MFDKSVVDGISFVRYSSEFDKRFSVFFETTSDVVGVPRRGQLKRSRLAIWFHPADNAAGLAVSEVSALCENQRFFSEKSIIWSISIFLQKNFSKKPELLSLQKENVGRFDAFFPRASLKE